MNSNELIKQGSDFLKKNKIKSHIIDTELLLSSVSGEPREKFLLKSNLEMSQNQIISFNNLISRRALRKEPIAYLINKKEFWSMNFNVCKDVLIPRPETEILVETVAKYFKDRNPFVLDIGTGSGCIIISLLKELKNSKGVAIDISNKALKIAKKNSKIYNTSKRIKFVNTSISNFNSFKFDLIVSNPPYIAQNEIRNLDEDVRKYEPLLALNGGNDGLDVIKKVIYKAREILKINGLLALEIGNGQYNKVSKILKKNCFRINYTIKDYKSNIRCLITTLNK